MSRLNRIQNETKQLEGGRFQKLCDSYLYRKRNWDGLVSLGSMEGADKTTKGIPDTYFFDNRINKYILVMYGTRKDSTAKLEKDIKEAIEKTKIDKNDIKEIICCHTSSNLTIEKDKKLRDLAGPIELTLIGIDTLSHDLLQFKYQDIIKDFLGIDESTEQVWNIEQFISIHDRSKTNAPLTTAYIDGVDTVEGLVNKLNNHQILLLSGVAGAGKTRAAIELCKKLPKDSNIICVKSNNMPVYQDIKDALDNNRVNYLLLDDANTITNFEAIVNLLRLDEYEKNLKIIITVRDYALSGLINLLEPFQIKIQEIYLMDDEQLELLINSITKISSRNLRKIMELSHNNPRLAVIAAIMMKNHNYEFLENGKDILGNYYNQIIKENALSQNEKISLFILSFKNKINLTNSESLEELATFFKIDFDIFLDSLNNLHDKELCDVFQDKAAKVSDQSLSDFITIDFIVNSRIFKIRDFFINLFPKYKKEIVKMLVLVNNFVTLKSWTNYLENEIKFIYNEVIEHFNKELFLEQYAVLIPIEALSYINQKIKNAESTEYQITQKEFEEKKGTNRVNDPIIKILCSLSNSERFNDAGIFLMKYFKKRQDKVYEVFSAIESKFDIDEDWKFYLEKRFCIFEIFSKQKNISELTALLIVNIAEKFLKFSGEKLIANGRSVVINRYTLVDGDYLSELHKKIFDTLFEVYNLDYVEVNNYIDKLLFNYPTYEVSNGFFKTVTSDLKCLENLFFKDLGKLDIRKEAIIFNLYLETKKLKLKPQPFLGYKLSITQSIYNTFSSNMLTYDDSNFNYEESQVLRLKKLNKVYEEYSDSLPWLFNTLSKYQSDELLDKYELQESIFMLYTHSKVDEKIKILIALLNSEFSIRNYHYDCFMERLSFKNGKKVLNSVKNELKESWHLSNLITSKNIDKDMLEELILLLRKLKNYEIFNCFSILSFESYIQLDTNILDILVSKYRDGEILESFFLPNYVSEEQANKIVAIVGHKELEEIYLDSFNTKNADKSGEIFKRLIRKSDANFIYLFLTKMNIEQMKLNFVNRNVQLKNIWESPIALEGIKKYLDFLIQSNRVNYFGIDPYLEEIFKTNIEKSVEFIKKEVSNTNDENRLVELYNLSLEIFDDEILLGLLELLKEKNVEMDFFEKLHLTMRIKSWSGSLVPYLDKEISFLNKLLNIFDDIEYISHSLVITSRIDSLKIQKEKELLSDYLE